MSIRFKYRCLKARYKDQKHELNELIKYLKNDDLFIDVGANKGSYLLTSCNIVNEGMVYAFEPQPNLFHYLQKEVLANKLNNVVLEKVALSNKKGTASLYIPGTQLTSPSATLEGGANPECTKNYSVKTNTVDDYFKNIGGNIGAIKIDVEGHERSVIEGALKTINHFKPLIIIEIENRHLVNDSVSNLLQYFYNLGYSGFFVHRTKGLVKTEEFNSSVHQCNTGERFWDNKNYCNNFIMKSD